jgi:hypothetical protein
MLCIFELFVITKIKITLDLTKATRLHELLGFDHRVESTNEKRRCAGFTKVF